MDQEVECNSIARMFNTFSTPPGSSHLSSPQALPSSSSSVVFSTSPSSSTLSRSSIIFSRTNLRTPMVFPFRQPPPNLESGCSSRVVAFVGIVNSEAPCFNSSIKEFYSVGDDYCLMLWDARVESTPVVKIVVRLNDAAVSRGYRWENQRL